MSEYATYLSIDDSLRRIANQAAFDKVIVHHADTIGSDRGPPFNVFLAPDIQRLAVRHQGRTAESGTLTGSFAGLSNDLPVGPQGLEP